MGGLTEHCLVFGLTDHEASVLQGALHERAENWPEDAETCKGIEAIMLDQLGVEDGQGGWEVLSADAKDGDR